MTRKQYRKKCQKLFCKAKRLGVKLQFNPDRFHHKRLNCLWHGGTVANINVNEELTITIEINGEVIAKLFNEDHEEVVYSKDKMNRGCFEDNMSLYLTTDKQLLSVLDSELLVLINNNWIEYNGFIVNKSKNESWFFDLGMIYDNIIDDDILTAINQVLNSLDKIKEEILNEAKEVA